MSIFESKAEAIARRKRHASFLNRLMINIEAGTYPPPGPPITKVEVVEVDAVEEHVQEIVVKPKRPRKRSRQYMPKKDQKPRKKPTREEVTTCGTRPAPRAFGQAPEAYTYHLERSRATSVARENSNYHGSPDPDA